MNEGGPQPNNQRGAKKRPLVLDSSAIMSGKPVSSEMVLYAPPSVITEFNVGGRSRRNLDYLLEAGLRVIDPKPKTVVEVEEVATQTGDYHRLSKTDMDVIALAKDVGGIIVTDDYSIQNVAATIKLPFEAAGHEAGITEVLKWEYRCRGCGKKYADGARKDCDVCGSEIKAVKAK
jgi:UPF0271 protein